MFSNHLWAKTSVNEDQVIVDKEDSLRIISMIKKASKLKDTNYKEARKIAIVALEEARVTDSNYLMQRALSINAVLDWYNGEHEQGLAKSFEGLSLAKELNDSAAIASRYSQVGLIHLYTSDYDSSLKYHEKSLEYYVGLKDTAQIIKIYGFISKVHIFRGDYLKGKEILLSTVVYRRKFNARDWGIINSTGNTEIIKKYYSESLINARMALASENDEPVPSNTKRFAYHNIGRAHLILGRPDSALYYFKHSIAIAKKLGVDEFWNELAGAYTDLKLYDSAIWASEKALANALDHGTRINTAMSYSALGKSYIAQAKYKEGITAYTNSLRLDQKMNHRRSQMRTMQWIAEIALNIRDYSTAMVYADSSLVIASKIGAKENYIEGQKIRAEVYKQKNEYKTALLIITNYDSLFHVLHEERTQLELAKMDLNNDIELSQLEILKLNDQQKLSSANLKNRTLTMFIVLIVGSFITLLLILNYLRTRKLLRLNKMLNTQQDIINDQYDELAVSNKEKEVLLGEIHHRVKNNLQVISSLLSVQRLQLSDESAKQAVLEGQNRVQTMGLIHESLYQNEAFETIDMHVYIEKLANYLISSFGYFNKEIKLNIDVSGVNLDVDLAVNIGLVTNELITNALKHAFIGYVDEKELDISLRKESEKELVLIVENNGLTSDKVFIEGKTSSFGLKLIQQIIKKYNGQINFDTSCKTMVTINLFI